MNLRHSALLLVALGTVAGLVLPTAPALADARQDVMSAAQRCAGIADDRTWLDCFYGSAQPMRARLGLPPAPVSQQRLVPQPMNAAPAYAAPSAPAYAPPPSYVAPRQAAAVNPDTGLPTPPPLPHRRSSGFFGNVFGDSRPVSANQRMASWAVRKGRFEVTLADGEIWRQDDGDAGEPKWRGASSRYVVNVYEGALGTYNMNVSDDSQLYKVHRVN